jgi:hypothetical protein
MTDPTGAPEVAGRVPRLSDEAQKLLSDMRWQMDTEKVALSAYIAGLEEEAAQLRAEASRQTADFDAAFYILYKDVAFVGTHWEAWPNAAAGTWPALCVHVSNYGADAEEAPREHWPMLAAAIKKHGDWAGEAYACWRRGVDEPGKGKLSEEGRAALNEFRQADAGRAALAAMEKQDE